MISIGTQSLVKNANLLTDFLKSSSNICWYCYSIAFVTVFSSDSEDDTGSPDAKKVTIPIDNWLKFKMDSETAALVIHLRQKWHALVLRRLGNPSRQLSQADEVKCY